MPGKTVSVEFNSAERCRAASSALRFAWWCRRMVSVLAAGNLTTRPAVLQVKAQPKSVASCGCRQAAHG